nr:hypothetical protein XAC3615_4010005 [Xanthomonas citri pv. citri]
MARINSDIESTLALEPGVGN